MTEISYTPYAAAEDYAALYPDGPEVSEIKLREASRHIDTLTFNRIVDAGFGSLTEFQREIVKEVCCSRSGAGKNHRGAAHGDRTGTGDSFSDGASAERQYLS